MINKHSSPKLLSFKDFVVKCKMMDEACRQWCEFIDEAPERRDGNLFTEFFYDICRDKYRDYLSDSSYRDSCNSLASLSKEEKYNQDFYNAHQLVDTDCYKFDPAEFDNTYNSEGIWCGNNELDEEYDDEI